MNAYDLALVIFDNPWVRFIMGLIGANVLMGIGMACFSRRYQFYLGDLGDFVWTRIFPYLMGWGAAKLLVITALVEHREWAMALEATVSAAVCLALIGKLLALFKEMFPQAPIPTWMTTKAKPETKATP